MMQIVLPRTWREEFERAAALKRQDIAHKEKAIRFDTKERERREDERDETRKEREGWMAVEAAFAPMADLEAFRVEMDDYDATIVEALMDNREALDALGAKIDDVMGEAEILPDGRRVFKTKDGQRVVDERGQELASGTIDPDMIDDQKPRWETLKALTDERVRLTEQRQQLLDYQTKLDDARERLDRGEITVKDLERMKTGLAADTPDAVKAKLQRAQADGAELAHANKPEIAAQPLPTGMDSLMRQTGLGPG